MKIKFAHLAIGAGMIVATVAAGFVGAIASLRFSGASYTLSYADFVSIMLAAISLLLTLLAFFIAILALVGWNSLSSRVKEASDEFLKDGFSDGATLHKLLKENSASALIEYLKTGIKEGDPLYQMLKRVSEEINYEGISSFQAEASEEDNAKRDD
ncbi:MAG: hypothetical protein NW206_02790 [Hyphomonadaceae bacterium]|nr:hypothetical protein [Hyphomonadaceae bacterium]